MGWPGDRKEAVLLGTQERAHALRHPLSDPLPPSQQAQSQDPAAHLEALKLGPSAINVSPQQDVWHENGTAGRRQSPADRPLRGGPRRGNFLTWLLP